MLLQNHMALKNAIDIQLLNRKHFPTSFICHTLQSTSLVYSTNIKLCEKFAFTYTFGSITFKIYSYRNRCNTATPLSVTFAHPLMSKYSRESLKYPSRSKNQSSTHWQPSTLNHFKHFTVSKKKIHIWQLVLKQHNRSRRTCFENLRSRILHLWIQ